MSDASAEYTRLLTLLWRQDPRGKGRGPRPSLDVDAVVDAALRLADRDGLAGVSMRAVARGLGVAPMSLYTYVPDKATLLALVVDAVYLRMPRPALHQLDWRERLVAVADANLQLLADHPWLDSLVSTQPPLGPGVLAKYEHELSAFDDVGLPDVMVDDCLTLLLTFVQGVGRTASADRSPPVQPALSDEQWWAMAAPLLQRLVDPAEFPRALRIGTAAGAVTGGKDTLTRTYRSGLACLLEGIAAVAAQSAGRASGRASPDPG